MHASENDALSPFRLHDERGFTLTDQLFAMRSKGCSIDDEALRVLDFQMEARSRGWEPTTIQRVVKEAANDAGVGPSYMELIRVVFAMACGHAGIPLAPIGGA